MQIESYLKNTAEIFPDKVALVCGDERWSYREIDHFSDTLADRILQNSFLPSDRALIFMENSLSSVVSLFAVLKAGGTFSIVNPQTKSHKLNFILRNSGAKLMIADARFRVLVRQSLSNDTELKTIVWTGDASADRIDRKAPPDYNRLPFETITAKSKKNSDSSIRDRKDIPDSLATLIYTSGSTGDPKGVMCSHRAMDAAAKSIMAYLEISSEDIIIVLLPLSFDYGLYQILMIFKAGGTAVLLRGFDYPQHVYQILRNEKVTVFPIVPTIANILLAKSRLVPLYGVSVRAITNTAAPLTVKQINGLTAIFPQASIYAMYGLTECKRVSYLPPAFLKKKTGSVGIPMPGVSIRIADENGNSLPPGEIGELLIQGPNVMQGYWNDPQATRKIFRRDSHGEAITLYSGDLFRQDAEGFLYFVARKDDMLKIRGERVYPLEIENVLQMMPAIREVAVLGLTNGNGESCLAAVVVPHDFKSLSQNDVKFFCRDRLDAYLIPQHILFASEIPKLPNGKIDKQSLKKTIWHSEKA